MKVYHVSAFNVSEYDPSTSTRFGPLNVFAVFTNGSWRSKNNTQSGRNAETSEPSWRYLELRCFSVEKRVANESLVMIYAVKIFTIKTFLSLMATLMLETDIEDRSCWWQARDIGDFCLLLCLFNFSKSPTSNYVIKLQVKPCH